MDCLYKKDSTYSIQYILRLHTILLASGLVENKNEFILETKQMIEKYNPGKINKDMNLGDFARWLDNKTKEIKND